MLQREKIASTLEEKERRLGPSHEIITPDSGLRSEVQARWMIDLLQAMYIKHGIAQSPEKVRQSIESGQCRCWFIVENGQPVAMTALVKQGDGSVELGRAVALQPGLGLGSIAMLRAGLDQLSQVEPLVAEVRVADEFSGIPSGEATQKVMFAQLGLKPHALAPMFNHGDPVRQEMFALATTQDLQESAAIALPNQKNARSHLAASLRLSRNLFDSDLELARAERQNHGFEVVQSEPFSVVILSQKGSSLESAEAEGLERSAFALLELELTPNNSAIIVSCLEAGWVACGVGRNLGPNDRPVLLMGKLKAQTLLAPSKIIEAHVGVQNAQSLNSVEKQFRK